MSKNNVTKSRARALKLAGKSVRQIAQELTISKSTIGRWTADIDLAESGVKRLWSDNKLTLANVPKNELLIIKPHSLNSSKTVFLNNSATLVSKFPLNKITKKIICATLYLTHGAKNTNYVSFVESDPQTVQIFVNLLRDAFFVHEDKFRGLVYLNSNQNEFELRKFWSKLTGIRLGQFTKSYIRNNSIGRVHHRGNFRVNYYDKHLAQELISIYQAFLKRLS